ncbi:MAG: phosphoenolpyruvate--protein phosphotransferase [Succinivibrionaceae bacterium]|nr:phosphoenolpyruvate--protein phosphotransferase [Succinivibrionaceae bacterium]
MDERQSKIMLALREITEQVSARSDPEEAMRLLVTKCRASTSTDCCSLYLCDHRKTMLRLVATDGLSQNAVNKVALRVGEGLVGVVGERRELLSLADAPSHPKFKYLPEVGEDEYHSFLGVPVLHQGELLGVLVIQTKKMRRFDDLEESFLVTISAQIASILAISAAKRDPDDEQVMRIKGRSATSGLALGRAEVWRPDIALEDVPVVCTDDPGMQEELLSQTLFQLQLEMDRRTLSMEESNQQDAINGYLAGYGRLLDDQQLQDEIIATIRSRGLMASSAVKEVIIKRMREAAERGDNDYISDIRGLGQQVVYRLLHGGITALDINESVILVVENLPPSLIAELPRDKIKGIVSLNGSDSTHAALLARDLNIPALFGVPLDLNQVDGHYLIVSCPACEVLLDPPLSIIDEFKELQGASQTQDSLLAAERYGQTFTRDGIRIDMRLNAGLNQHGGEIDLKRETDGIGLYRTEIAFMLTQSFPSEQQQTEWYTHLLSEFAPLHVCMRTLDVGSDKGLSYFPMKEHNPALGWRGVRITLDLPQIFSTQLRAMLRAHQRHGNLSVMIPMVSRLDEVLEAKRLLEAARREVEEETGAEVPMPLFGFMVEVPAMLFMLEEIVPHVDFISVGSNDLIQYLLAVDRSNPRVSRFYDIFHPSVLRAFDTLARKCRELGTLIAVCGEVAAVPLGALMLVSLGITHLSMNHSEIARIKYILRRASVADLGKVAQEALTKSTSQEIHDLYLGYAQGIGLGDLVERHRLSQEGDGQ